MAQRVGWQRTRTSRELAVTHDLPLMGDEVLREPLLDAENAASLLGIPRSSVYAYAKRGELPHVKIGRHLKFIRSDLERALIERRVGI
jgi:excisionase family DNA binding protein